MAKKEERFVKVLSEGSSLGELRILYVDKETGVTYADQIRLRCRAYAAAGP